MKTTAMTATTTSSSCCRLLLLLLLLCAISANILIEAAALLDGGTTAEAAAASAFPGRHHYYEQEGQQGESNSYSRSPCPAINTLANHGYIRRDGRNVGLEDMALALSDIFGVETKIILAMADYNNLPKVFDLVDLYDRDHDGSLFHQDRYFFHAGSFPDFDQTSFDDLVALATNEAAATNTADYDDNDDYNYKVTKEVIGKHIKQRILNSKENNPESIINLNSHNTIVRDAMKVFLFGNYEDLTVPISDLYSFVAYNKFPESWIPRTMRGLPKIQLLMDDDTTSKEALTYLQEIYVRTSISKASKYEQACLGTFTSSGFDLLRTDLYDRWLNDESTLNLAQTGVYKGPDGIAEYINFLKGDYFDYYKAPEPASLADFHAVSYKEDQCEILVSHKNRIQGNRAVLGQEMCMEIVIGYKLKFTIQDKFTVQRINIYYDGSFLSHFLGDVMNTNQVRDYVCDVFMSPVCNETATFNEISSKEQCRAEYDKLPSTDSLGYADSHTKGCRIIHSTFAAKNAKHCPHISFLPQEDPSGAIKCQTSKNTSVSDLFSPDELQFIETKKVQYGLQETPFANCDYLPIVAEDVVVTARPALEAENRKENSKKGLRFHTFLPELPCADGSPSGIYVEENPKDPKSRRHVIAIVGGGACTSIEDCNSIYSYQPFQFSSEAFPTIIQGDSILSSDPDENEFHDYTKWMVPYCSQDFFLGDIKKGKIGNFTHAGSAILNAAIKYWKESVKQSSLVADSDGYYLDTVVVAGVSAGGVGLMNHVQAIRESVNEVKTRKVKFILDSMTVSPLPYAGRNSKAMMSTYVDLDDHELCRPFSTTGRLYERSSALPCCLSIDCMLRHDPRLSSFFFPRENNSTRASEEMLILDSAYDFVALLPGTGLVPSIDGKGTEKQDPSTNGAYGLVEFAATRKMRALETSSLVKVPLQHQQEDRYIDWNQGPRIKWLMTSCFTHSFISVAVEFLHLACTYGDYSNLPHSYACVDKGNTLSLEYDQVQVRLWQTTDRWDIAEFQGESIHKIVDDFVLERQNASNTDSDGLYLPGFVNNQEVIDLRLDSCQGPNCQTLEEAKAKRCPSCQKFLEIESFFIPIPRAASSVLGALLLSFVVIAVCVRSGKRTLVKPDESGGINSATTKTLELDCQVQGLSVKTCGGIQLLHDIDLYLRSGTITVLCGKSGSGKSTLLKSMSHEKLHGATVSFKAGAEHLNHINTAYLRQHDDSEGFSKLFPVEYIRFTADILRTSPHKLHYINQLCESLFVQDHSESVNPFLKTPIESLSGGQRRILNIAATLLVEPNLLLLDEPLSGLDSASSNEVMSVLPRLASKAHCAVFVTMHQPTETLLGNCDRLMVLEAGRVIHHDDIRDTDFTINLLARLIKAKQMPRLPSIRDLMGTLEASEPLAQDIRDVDYIQSIFAGLCSDEFTDNDVREYTDSIIDKYSSMGDSKSIGLSMDSSDGDSKSIGLCMDSSDGDEFTDKDVREYTDSIIPPKSSPVVRDGNSTDLVGDVSDREPTSTTHRALPRTLFDKNSLLQGLWQIRPIARRLQPQFGWDLAGCCAAFAITCLVAAFLRYDESFAKQTLIASLTVVVGPSCIFPYKSVEHAYMWKAHQREMYDRFVFPSAFQAATSFYTFLMPLLSVMCAQPILYWFLKWDYDTFLTQMVIASLQLLINLQIGRTLMVWFRGEFSKAVRVYTVYLLFSLVFNGVFINPSTLPNGLSWLFPLSSNFWGIGGSIMLHFDPVYYSNAESCADMLSCILTDGNVIVRRMGYATKVTSSSSIIVQTAMLLFLFVLEFIGLRYQCNDNNIQERIPLKSLFRRLTPRKESPTLRNPERTEKTIDFISTQSDSIEFTAVPSDESGNRKCRSMFCIVSVAIIVVIATVSLSVGLSSRPRHPSLVEMEPKQQESMPATCRAQEEYIRDQRMDDVGLDKLYRSDFIEYSIDPVGFLKSRSSLCGNGTKNFVSLGRVIIGEHEDVNRLLSMEGQVRGRYLGRGKLRDDRGSQFFPLALSDSGTDTEAGRIGLYPKMRSSIIDTIIVPAQATIDSDSNVTRSLESYVGDMIDELSSIDRADFRLKRDIIDTFASRWLMKAMLKMDADDTTVKLLKSLFRGDFEHNYVASIMEPLASEFVSEERAKNIQIEFDKLRALIESSPLLQASSFQFVESMNITKDDYTEVVGELIGIAGITGLGLFLENMLRNIPDQALETINPDDSVELEAAVLELARLNTAVRNVNIILSEETALHVGGETKLFPKGTPVASNLPLANWNENIFSDPFVFNHTRHNLFEDTVSFATRGYDPNSMPRRSCPGKALAMKAGSDVLAAWIKKHQQ